MDGKWEYDGAGLFQSVEPIFVASLQGQFDIWYDVAGQRPSTKQIAAWNEFCNLSPDHLREQLIKGLAKFDMRLSTYLKDSERDRYSSYMPKLIKKVVRKAILTLQKSQLPLGTYESSVFKCDSLVIPLQEEAQSHFVLMNFELGAGTIANRSYGLEMEALLCNGQLLLMGENSGLWTRLEWKEEFDTPIFQPETARHPYW